VTGTKAPILNVSLALAMPKPTNKQSKKVIAIINGYFLIFVASFLFFYTMLRNPYPMINKRFKIAPDTPPFLE
jgi:hypothetical protein